MSILVSTQVWRDAPYAGARLLVLLALADSASDEGYSWPRIGTIAYKARISERQCQRHIAALIRDGWLARMPRFEGDDNTIQLSNLFRVTPPGVMDDTPPVSPVTPRTVIESSVNRKRTVARTRAASTPQENVETGTPDEDDPPLPPPPLSPDAETADERDLAMPLPLLWSQVAMRLRQSGLTDAEWSNWIAPLRIARAWWDDDRVLRVRIIAPGSYHAGMIDQRFVYVISDAIAKLLKLPTWQVGISVHAVTRTVKEAV